MQTLNINAPEGTACENKTPKIGFWRRQFQDEATIRQNKFDWVFGVVLPVLCIFFDPPVFQGLDIHDKGILHSYRPFAYLLSFFAVMATLAWLLWGPKLSWANALLSGLFTVSAVNSLVIGIAILPFSLLGLIFVIGALGFTPFFSSFIYLRIAVRAYRSAGQLLDKRVLANSWMLGAVLSEVIPYLFNVWFE